MSFVVRKLRCIGGDLQLPDCVVYKVLQAFLQHQASEVWNPMVLNHVPFYSRHWQLRGTNA